MKRQTGRMVLLAVLFAVAIVVGLWIRREIRLTSDVDTVVASGLHVTVRGIAERVRASPQLYLPRLVSVMVDKSRPDRERWFSSTAIQALGPQSLPEHALVAMAGMFRDENEPDDLRERAAFLMGLSQNMDIWDTLIAPLESRNPILAPAALSGLSLHPKAAHSQQYVDVLMEATEYFPRNAQSRILLPGTAPLALSDAKTVFDAVLKSKPHARTLHALLFSVFVKQRESCVALCARILADDALFDMHEAVLGYLPRIPDNRSSGALAALAKHAQPRLGVSQAEGAAFQKTRAWIELHLVDPCELTETERLLFESIERYVHRSLSRGAPLAVPILDCNSGSAAGLGYPPKP